MPAAKQTKNTIIAREQAIQLGLKHYYTGKPCRHGHIAERAVVNGTCMTCSYNSGKSLRASQPHRKAASNARYYSKNREMVLDINARWRTSNPDQMRAIRRAHYRRNADDYNDRARRRKKHIAQATPPWADLEAIRIVYREASQKARELGIPHDVDHIVPLRGYNVCGLHVHWNLRAIPATENRGKDNNPRWMKRRGASHDRDVNAARNILRLGLEHAASC